MLAHARLEGSKIPVTAEVYARPEDIFGFRFQARVPFHDAQGAMSRHSWRKIVLKSRSSLAASRKCS
jgi:hypothetical protein